ncbi:MAG: hypothetical protein ABI300_00645 [Rhodanobacter sp.]
MTPTAQPRVSMAGAPPAQPIGDPEVLPPDPAPPTRPDPTAPTPAPDPSGPQKPDPKGPELPPVTPHVPELPTPRSHGMQA